MSYVEHCKKHGQYKGDYCGECIDDLHAENARMREALKDISRWSCGNCRKDEQAQDALEEK